MITTGPATPLTVADGIFALNALIAELEQRTPNAAEVAHAAFPEPRREHYADSTSFKLSRVVHRLAHAMEQIEHAAQP